MRARAAFTPARAPAAWARGMERAAASLAALRRASAWAVPLASVRPRLLERGAWDEGLAALASPPVRPDDPGARAPRFPRASAPAAEPFARSPSASAVPRDPRRASPAAGPLASPPRRGRTPFDGLDALRRPGVASAPAGESTRGPEAGPYPVRDRARASAARPATEGARAARGRTIDPAALPRQAEPAFLAALATRAAAKTNGAAVDPASASPRLPASRSSSSSAAAGGRRGSEPPSADRRPARRAAPGAAPAEDARRAGAGWIGRVAERAGRRLAGTRVDAASARPAPAARGESAVAPPLLAAQWDAPIAPPVVTAAWLAEVAARRTAAVAPPTGERTRPAARGTARPPSREGAPGAADAPAAAGASGPDAGDFARAGGVRPARLPPLEGTDGGRKGTATIPPPLQSTVPGAAAVRLPGAPEEGGAGEDLGELARRIKTILDDEARRFGIDV